MDVLTSPCWYDALTLKERLAALRSGGAGPSWTAATPDPASRLQAWRAQAPFGRAEMFARRLAAEGITEEELARILVDSPEVVRDRIGSRPPWLARIEEAYGAASGTEAAAERARAGDPTFVDLAMPLIDAACTTFRRSLVELAARSFLPFAVDAMVAHVRAYLRYKLHPILERTLVLELNVARLMETLAGDTPEARFRGFLVQLRNPRRALAVLAEYPVVARQLVRAIDHGVAFHLEFLCRLASDWSAIVRELAAGQDPGKLEELSGGAGDSHRQGRSVLIARFASGLQVVYKPRPMALDVHFQELLAWLNERGIEPLLRTFRILDRGDYGWSEFVAAEGCAAAEEVDRFYRRQGSYLAILHALDATDFHMENLVAAGEHPVLLDLEALFHARLGDTVTTGRRAHRAAGAAVEDSVLRIGLLPQRVWATAESEGIDLSGLGSLADQKTPFRVPRWKQIGTDAMHLGREHVTIPAAKNRPVLDGQEVDVLDHADAIVAGFTATYQFLERHARELLAPHGPVERFAEDEVRIILRPTQTYGALLRESYHPDVLRNALDRALLFDRLWGPAEHLTHLARVIPAEIDDLTDGDIPMFTSRPASRDLWTSSGERLADFFSEPSLAHVRRRIDGLGADELDRQLWFVRASLATVSRRPRATHRAGAEHAAGAVRNDALVAAARAIGDELERRALRLEGAATWLGLTQPREEEWILQPLAIDLYDGLPGVALFLAHLAAITGEARYDRLARAAVASVRDDLDDARRLVTSIGGFSGLGGTVYALTQLGALWRDPELVGEAQATVRHVPPLVERDELLDVIGGAAGCIPALLALHRHTGSPEALDAARQCGERLVATACAMERGVGWKTAIAKEKPLSGFSHGAAGMAWALLQLATVTGEARFRGTALAGIEYERTLFSPEQQNWWDLRDLGTHAPAAPGAYCSMSWCHGAPGIGLSRLAVLGLLDDEGVREEVREEVRVATSVVARTGFGDNHSLCHGDLGNLELLGAAARALRDPAVQAGAEAVAAGVVDEVRSGRWLCGNPLRVESPGLMTGLAGIGYGLLRLAYPERIPSVLLLEPPVTDG